MSETDYNKVMDMVHRDTLNERIHKIDMVMTEYGEENFFISFSGGKDSVVLHHLIDMARPGNKIPRVFANTGIEYNSIVNFVKIFVVTDPRFVILTPSTPIKQILEKEGYPFKSKHHSHMVDIYQRLGFDNSLSVRVYCGKDEPSTGVKRFPQHMCPQKLMYQFSDDFKLRISSKCCDALKKNPIHKWQKENNKPYAIVGIMAAEGGQRETAKCTVFADNKLKSFQPLAPLTREWEEWFIKEYNIELCRLYYPPYNMTRTGCKGCPFNITLQRELDTLEKYFPNERKQCERIWGPVYDEYRRIGYRKMRPIDEGRQITMEELLQE